MVTIYITWLGKTGKTEQLPALADSFAVVLFLPLEQLYDSSDYISYSPSTALFVKLNITAGHAKHLKK